jgi:hypothetical protein
MWLLPRLATGAVVATLALTSSCASSARMIPADALRDGPTPAVDNPDVLTPVELERRGASEQTALDAIERLRPMFLARRGLAGTRASAGRVQVSVDDGALTGVDALRGVPAWQVTEIRYLSALDAAQRFGAIASGGPVILVRRK